MDAFWAEVVFYGPFVVMGGMAVLAALMVATYWRRAWAVKGTLPMEEMMARQGVQLPQDLSAGAAYDLAHAARRCAGCAARTTCRTWLDSGARSGAEEFCPNYAFMERVKHEGLRLGVTAL